MSYIFGHSQLFTEPQEEQNEEEGAGEEDDEADPFRDFFIKFLINL